MYIYICIICIYICTHTFIHIYVYIYTYNMCGIVWHRCAMMCMLAPGSSSKPPESQGSKGATRMMHQYTYIYILYIYIYLYVLYNYIYISQAFDRWPCLKGKMSRSHKKKTLYFPMLNIQNPF